MELIGGDDCWLLGFFDRWWPEVGSSSGLNAFLCPPRILVFILLLLPLCLMDDQGNNIIRADAAVVGSCRNEGEDEDEEEGDC